MTVLIGEWDSPGADRRRSRFEEEFKRLLGSIERPIAAQASNVFGPSSPQQAPSPVLAAQRAAFGQAARPAFNLQSPQLFNPALHFQQQAFAGEPLRTPANLVPGGPFGNFNALQEGLLFTSRVPPRSPGLAPGELPLVSSVPQPGAMGTGISRVPTSAAALPGANDNIFRDIIRALEFERKQTQRVTRPAFRAAGETVTENVLGVPGGRVLRAAGVPVPEAPFKREVGELAADIGGEVALVSNLIPLPVIDAAAARLLGKLPVIIRGGQQFLSQEGRSQVRNKIRLLLSDPATDSVVRAELRRADQGLASARPVAGAAPEPRVPEPGAFEPEPVRPPEGQEAPLFPELEERAARAANVEAAARAPGPEPVDAERIIREGGVDLTGEELDKSMEAMIGRAQNAGADEATTNVLSQAYRDAIDLGVTQARAPASLIGRRAPRLAALADNVASKFQGRVQGGVGDIRERAAMVEHALNEVSKSDVDRLVTGINQRLYGRARTGGFLNEITYIGPDEFADAANGQYRDLVLASTPPQYWKGVPSEFYDDLTTLRNISAERKLTAESLGHPSAARRDNYLRQTWEEVDEALALGADPRRGGLISPSKARIIPNHAVGINAGLTPAQKNVGELMTESIGLWNRAIAESWERKIVLQRYGQLATGKQTLASGKTGFQHPLYKGYAADREIVGAVEGLHQPPGKITRGVVGEAAAFKNTVFGPLDFGVIGTHIPKAITLGGPQILGNQIVRSLALLRFSPAVHMRQAIESGKLPLMTKMANNGLHLGLGPSAVTTGKGTVLKYIPLLKRIDPSVSAFIDAKARVEFGILLNWFRVQLAEGNLALLHMTGRNLDDPATWKTAMDWANTMTGASRGAQTPGRRAMETASLTSFQMTRAEMATLGAVAKAATVGSGSEKILATMTLASFGAMIYGLGSAINMAFGNGPVEFNPAAKGGKWATVQIGGQNIPLLPQRGLIRAIGKSYNALAEMDTEKVTQIWAQHVLSKGGPGTVGIAAPAAGFGFQPDIGFRTGDLDARFRFLNAAPMPPLVSQVVTESDSRGAIALGFSTFGFNPFPESVFEKLEEAQNPVAQRLFGKNYADLDVTQQAQVDKDAGVQAAQAEVDRVPPRNREGEGFDVAEELRVSQIAAQEQDDAAWNAGTMPGDTWRRNHSDREREFFIRRKQTYADFGIEFDDEEAKNQVDAAINAYFDVDFVDFTDPETGEKDYHGFRKAQLAALEPLTQEQRLRFENDILGENDTEVEVRFRAISRKLESAPPQIVGLTKDERQYVLEFRRDALALRRKWQENGWQGSVRDALAFLGREWGESDSTIGWAIALGSSRFKQENTNRAYLNFLYGPDEQELRRFYPDIFSVTFDLARVS